MEYELNILSSQEDFAEVRHSIKAFLDTYGDCEVKLYEKGAVIEEDGLLISGEYGTLDTLFAPVTDPRLKRSANFEDGRMWMEWNAVVYASGE
jgi:hypothetical protein